MSKPRPASICCDCGAVNVALEDQWHCVDCVNKRKVHERKTKRSAYRATRRAKLDQVVPKLYSHARLGRLSSGVSKAIKALKEGKGLMLWGQSGVGKSYAACAALRMYAIAGRTIQRTAYDRLCMEVRATFNGGSGTELDVIDRYIAPDVLVIEDVGTSVAINKQESDFSLRVFLQILDQRIEKMRTTIITTNKNLESLRASFDGRVASRIQGYFEILNLRGKDRRATC